MSIPTRFNLGQTPAGRFLELIQPPMGAGARPAARIAETGGMGRMRGDVPMRLPQQRQQPRMPLQAAILSGAGATPTAGFVSSSPSAPPKSPPSINDRIGGMLPAAGTPAAAGLGAAGARMLQLSGYSDKPIAMSQILGEAAQAYRTEAKEERRAQAAAELAKQQRETDLKLKMMEIKAARAKESAGRDLDVAKLRRDLRKDFNSSSEYYGEAKQFWTDVVNYSKPEQSSAADLALVFSYMKMLDPDSVVREGEQMQVRGLGGIGAEARGLLSRLGIGVEGTYEGGMLIIDPTVREDIRKAAAVRFADLTQGQVELETFTKEEGGRAGLTPDFFKSYVSGTGTMKKPFVVQDLSELPNTAKDGDYAIVNGVFQQISEAS